MSSSRGSMTLAVLAASCVASLPNHALTPGARDPAVTQANVQKTVCMHGYTARVRPPVSYTAPLKRELQRAYGRSGPASAYELDHLLPLELGGAPRDRRNLWPEPIAQARRSDREENALHRRLCDGSLTLAQAQTLILKFKSRVG